LRHGIRARQIMVEEIGSSWVKERIEREEGRRGVHSQKPFKGGQQISDLRRLAKREEWGRMDSEHACHE